MKKYLFILLILISSNLFGQTTFNTVYTTNSPYFFASGGGYVTFSIQNTNAYPVSLTDLSIFQLPEYKNNIYKLWYSATSLNGTGYPIAAPTWNLIAESTTEITTTTQAYVNPFKCIGFVIPANTTYRFAIEGSMGIMFRASGVNGATTYTCTPNVFSSGGVNLQVGDFLNGGLAIGRAGLTNLGLVYGVNAFFFGTITVAPANSFTDLYINSVSKPSNACNQTNAIQTASLCNRSSHTVDFATNNTTVNFNVNGPNGVQNQSFLLNTGSIAPCTCITPTVVGMNYSAGGTYTVTATATVSGVVDINTANNTFIDSFNNYKITLNKNQDSICQNGIPSGFDPFVGSACLTKTGSITLTMNTNPTVPVDGTSDATAGLNFASGTLPQLPTGAVITGGKLQVTSLRNNTGSFANEVRFNIYGPAGPATPFVPGAAGNQSGFNYFRFNYDNTLLATQLNDMYNTVGVGGNIFLGYWESLDNLVGSADIQINAQTFPTVTKLIIEYTIPPTPRWYSNPSGGPLLFSGSSFNPFFVTGGIPNTTTPGTSTFYAACNGDTTCRVPFTVLIKPSPAVNQDSIYACELISSTGNSIFDITTVDANVANNIVGATVNYYFDQSLTALIPNPTNLNTSSTVVFSKVEVPGGCASSDSVLLIVNAKPDFTNSIFTGFQCAPNTVDITNLLNPLSTIPPGTDTMYFEDPNLTIPYLTPFAIATADTVYMLFVTNTSPACSDTAEAYINIIPANTNIASQDLGLNISIAGTVGCFNSTFTDGMSDTLHTTNDCRRVAAVTDLPNSTSLGVVTICEDIFSGVPVHNGQPYVNRSYQITAANSDTAYVCLYYLDNDFQDYNATAVFSSPTWPMLPSAGGPANLNNITITKVDNGDLNTPGHTATAIPNSLITSSYDPATTVWTVCFPVSGFSYFYLHAENPGNAPLPVNLMSFTGTKKDGVSQLAWTTATETNNSHFILERSKDGNQFNAISGRILSQAEQGNSQTPLSYSHTDVTPYQGHNYYRLQQHDIDGNISYSKVVDLYFGNETMITLYPNPTSQILNIDLNTPLATEAKVNVLDATGRIVKVIYMQFQAGANSAQIDLQELADGMYMIQITNGKGLNFAQPIRKN